MQDVDQYYTKIYKNWLVNQFDMDVDIHNMIQSAILTQQFKIPELDDIFTYYGIVFEKRNLPLHKQHNHKDKEVLLRIVAGKIVEVLFFYIEDLTHYYTINFAKSGIHTISMVKQLYHMYKQDNQVYVSTIDPVLIAKWFHINWLVNYNLSLKNAIFYIIWKDV